MNYYVMKPDRGFKSEEGGRGMDKEQKRELAKEINNNFKDNETVKQDYKNGYKSFSYNEWYEENITMIWVAYSIHWALSIAAIIIAMQ